MTLESHEFIRGNMSNSKTGTPCDRKCLSGNDISFKLRSYQKKNSTRPNTVL